MYVVGSKILGEPGIGLYMVENGKFGAGTAEQQDPAVIKELK